MLTCGWRVWQRVATASALLPVLACSDFLSGPGISTNPNLPTTATPDELWVGVQASAMFYWESQGKFSNWAQFFVGIDKQQGFTTDYKNGADRVAANVNWDPIYTSGGLKDLRALEAGAAGEVPANLKLRGEARVIEALYMGTAADVFGSVPYSAALTARPTFDSQPAVYQHVLALLDSAIQDLGSTGKGAASIDFFYANDFAKWVAAAHSLKARYYMHTARTSAAQYDVAILEKIVSQADSGIRSPGGDLQANHGITGNPNDVNLFYYAIGGGGSGAAASAVTMALMDSAGENYLLPRYYEPNLCCGEFFGTLPDESHSSDSLSTFHVALLQPTGIVTFAETRMLLAEAQFRLGNLSTARGALDQYRDSIGAPALGSLVGSALLGAILREKFIQPLPNMEQWNDYLRTCYPNIAVPRLAALGYVPARLPVAADELTANGANVPTQPDGNPGNPNNFKNSVAIDGAPCYGRNGSAILIAIRPPPIAAKPTPFRYRAS